MPRFERRGLLVSKGHAALVLVMITCGHTIALAEPDLWERKCLSSTAAPNLDTPKCNDGFFIRVSFGPSYLWANLRNVQVDGSERYQQRISAHGGVAVFDFMLGGTPAPGLLVGGYLGIAKTSNASYSNSEADSAEPGVTYVTNGTGLTLQRFTLGPALAFFPYPTRGLVFDIRPAIGGVSTSGRIKIDAALYGLQLGAGYELWVTPNFGIGLSLRGELAGVRETLAVRRGADYKDGWLSVVGLAVTGTMH